VVEDVSFRVGPGEVLGLVGESGSGKTTTALALLGYARPGVRIAAGTIEVAGTRLSGLSETAVRRYRGRLVSYVPQDPAAALNPSIRVGDQVGGMVGRSAETERRVGEALELVQLPSTRDFRRRFPHQLSGGQQQRVGIARALALRPKLMLFDEPTSALDPELVGEVLQVIGELAQRGMTMVLATHEMSFARDIASRVCFLDGGRIVEEGPPAQIFSEPREPRTRQFLERIVAAKRL
jgi:peptide/nickel transport system ATP-binding protein